MKCKLSHLFSLALLLLSLALLCTACKPQNPTPEQPEEEKPMLTLIENGTTTYTVVRPDNCEAVLKTCVTTFIRALKTISGAEEINVTTDYEAATEWEILVGATNRPETAQVTSRLGDADYRIEIVNNKPVIVGRDDSAVAFTVLRSDLNRTLQLARQALMKRQMLTQ